MVSNAVIIFVVLAGAPSRSGCFEPRTAPLRRSITIAVSADTAGNTDTGGLATSPPVSTSGAGEAVGPASGGPSAGTCAPAVELLAEPAVGPISAAAATASARPAE